MSVKVERSILIASETCVDGDTISNLPGFLLTYKKQTETLI